MDIKWAIFSAHDRTLIMNALMVAKGQYHTDEEVLRGEGQDGMADEFKRYQERLEKMIEEVM